MEGSMTPEQHVAALLVAIGEDPTREGLVDTPSRVVRALREMVAGYQMNPKTILSRQFEVHNADQMVCVRRIGFASLCEHHLLPFIGHASVAYLPQSKVVGLSKIPRLVECFARRPQLQERMTRQIADAIEEHLAPRGVAVVVRAQHSCMACRGVRQVEADMVTSVMSGILREAGPARDEFLHLIGTP